MSIAPGTRIGSFEVLSLIGSGGMGEVYRARDAKLKRDVALKVLPEMFASDPDRMARFQREAEVLASLNHPKIAQIYGVEHNALVMELVEGESPGGPMPFDDAWQIASQIAGALEYAHVSGVIHRDLKPANVKVTPQGVVKLLDFGLAKAFNETVATSASDSSNSPTLTIGSVAGAIVGTAAYMAPEQARGKLVDKRADIWAFGVVLYELITGRRPFGGAHVSEILASVIKDEPEWQAAGPRAQRLLRKCLAIDRKDSILCWPGHFSGMRLSVN
jgi:serine/threonine-protein kinase